MVRHDFGWALHALRSGFRVSRTGWNGKGMWLELRAYIYIKTAEDELVPWTASQGDLLGEDWFVVDDVDADGVPRSAA